MTESAAHHPNRFLDDLIAGMRVTAESSRHTTLEQCQSDAKAYVEGLHARTKTEEQELRKSADDDVATIRERSKARLERIRVETDQRISQRRELLEQELQEYNAAIELEISRVEERVTAFEQEVSAFFEQLLQGAGADPTTFATMASQVPDPPTFQELDRRALAAELRATRDGIARAEAGAAGSDGSNGTGEQLPDYWWLDSPAGLASHAKPEDEK